MLTIPSILKTEQERQLYVEYILRGSCKVLSLIGHDKYRAFQEIEEKLNRYNQEIEAKSKKLLLKNFRETQIRIANKKHLQNFRNK